MSDAANQPPPTPDRRPGWETLYLATEIKRCIDSHQSAYETWLGGGSTPSLVLEHDPVTDLSQRNDAVVAIVGRFEPLFSPATLEVALGRPGEPGDEEEIARVAAGIGSAFGDLIEWSSTTRGAEPPPDWQDAYRALAQIVDTPLRQIRTFGDEFCAQTMTAIDRQRSGQDPGPAIEMSLTVSIPDEDSEAVARALDAVARRTTTDAGGTSLRHPLHVIRWALVGAAVVLVLRALGLLG